MAISYELVVSYKLRMPSRQRRGRKALQLRPEEADLYSRIVRIVGREPEADFAYDYVKKRRNLGWYFRSSRGARSYSKRVKALRRDFRAMGLKSNIVIHRSRNESLDEAIQTLLSGSKPIDSVIQYLCQT